MRWLCFLLLANTAPAVAQRALRFDLTAIPATRDSFVFFLRGEDRGWAVWQYEIRRLEMTQQVLYTARSEFRPVEEESLRVVLNRLTGEPIATFHHPDGAAGVQRVAVAAADNIKEGGQLLVRFRG